MSSRSTQKAFFASLALVALAWHLTMTIGDLGQTTFDDAYMLTRYAKHWLSGAGFAWNAADGPSYGVTTPAYLFVITAVLGLTHGSDAMVLTLASYLTGLLAAASLVVLGFLVQGDSGKEKSWMPLLVVPWLLLLPPFRYHSLTGMETTFSLFANSLLACSIVLTTRRRTVRALAVCLLSGLLAYTTRPDNGLYALFLPPLFFVATDRALWRYAVWYAAIFAVLLGLSLIVNRFLFGDVLPLPFYAKAKGFYEGYMGVKKWNPIKAMLLFGTAALPFLVLIVCTASKRTLPRVLAIAGVIAATFAYFMTVTQIMGMQARYYYPSLAFVLLAAFTTFFCAEANVRAQAVRFGFVTFLVLVALLPVASGAARSATAYVWERHVIPPPTAVQGVTQYQNAEKAALPKLDRWQSVLALCDLLEHVPSGTVFAASEYGLIGSRFPEMTIIDLVGLHDRMIAHDGFSAAYVVSREPDVIWLPHEDYTRTVTDLLDSPLFQKHYAYYPGAYAYGIALRTSSAKHAAIERALSLEFSRLYPGRELSDYKAEPAAPPAKR